MRTRLLRCLVPSVDLSDSAASDRFRPAQACRTAFLNVCRALGGASKILSVSDLEQLGAFADALATALANASDGSVSLPCFPNTLVAAAEAPPSGDHAASAAECATAQLAIDAAVSELSGVREERDRLLQESLVLRDRLRASEIAEESLTQRVLELEDLDLAATASTMSDVPAPATASELDGLRTELRAAVARVAEAQEALSVNDRALIDLNARFQKDQATLAAYRESAQVSFLHQVPLLKLVSSSNCTFPRTCQRSL